ncbi:MAG: hypothetical protein IJH78_00145 [Clostridia bacterium]|nr:hypothetical protein [Clostridia bacterium]
MTILLLAAAFVATFGIGYLIMAKLDRFLSGWKPEGEDRRDGSSVAFDRIPGADRRVPGPLARLLALLTPGNRRQA